MISFLDELKVEQGKELSVVDSKTESLLFKRFLKLHRISDFVTKRQTAADPPMGIYICSYIIHLCIYVIYVAIFVYVKAPGMKIQHKLVKSKG